MNDITERIGSMIEALEAGRSVPAQCIGLLLDCNAKLAGLRHQILELETAAAVREGSLSSGGEADPPFQIEHNQPGNAPV